MSMTLERLTDFIDFKNGKAVQLAPEGDVRVFGSNDLDHSVMTIDGPQQSAKGLRFDDRRAGRRFR